MASHPVASADAARIVAAFEATWSAPRDHGYRFLDSFSPDVVLVAPLAGRSRGRRAGYDAFRRTFALLPDLTAEVHDWAVSDDHLWISMTFHTAVRGQFAWPSVDVLRLTDGVVTQRRAYFDPLPVIGYFVRHPTLAWRYLAARLRAAPRYWPDGSSEP
jgi:ketosteroid isomerase-like protein